jgi:predicted TIM-barrel fold metal-dependent hydrolase
MVDRHPDVDIVIDHMADSDIFNPFQRDNLIGIAQNPRVHLKTGHVWATSSEAYPWRDRQELVRFACETFGPRRIMWGSDWPLCARHTIYRQTFGFLTEDTDFLSGDDLEWILGGTARCLWPIGGVRPDRLSQTSNYRSGQVPK